MRIRLPLIPIFIEAVAVVVASQYPLNSKLASYDAGLFSPVADIRTLSTDEYVTLTHPAHPRHSVRIKQNGGKFCDDGVKSYTGYIDIDSRHMFFWFFESRGNPSEDDVILWTNGGPGCSSSLGLLMELGPCRIQPDGSVKHNPYSWIETANIIFIDQPVGVGFSYSDFDESVSTSEEVARDISAFLRIFVDNFKQFEGNSFHLAGESYGGRYIPTFGAQVADDNRKAVQAGFTPIKLISLIIGNGLTDSIHMQTSYYDIQCTNASVEPFQDISTCVRMRKAIPRCEAWLKKSCADIYDEMDCRAAVNFCEDELMDPIDPTGKNIYDVSKDCEGDIADTLCYPVTKEIAKFLNRPEIKAELGVDAKAANFTPCSNKVGIDFDNSFDSFAHHADDYVAELLERDIRVLIYVGAHDMICNWIGNERFTLNLHWSGQKHFVQQELREWKVENHRAGRTRSYGGLTFATVEGAGHMVPYDKPVEALSLISRWLSNERL